MRISIGQNTKSAMTTLGISSYPFGIEELKSKYRSKAKEHHPDIQSNEDKKKANEMMREIITSYKVLVNLADYSNGISEEDRIKAVEETLSDEDMFRLWKDCPDCNGTGKRKLYDNGDIEECPNCDKEIYNILGFTRASGRKTLKCRFCKDGKFTQRSGRVVDCYSCHGTGIWKTVRCNLCHGTRYIEREVREIISTCGKCSGSGKVEIKPFNPVIPKGGVMI